MNLFAIVQEKDREVKRIRTNQSLQSQLETEFHRQRDLFLDNYDIVDFDPRYKLDDDELFNIPGYELPDFIMDPKN